MPFRIILLFSSLIILTTTFNLNNGPFSTTKPAVNMFANSHGNPILFVLTALAGAYFVIFLSSVTPQNKILAFVGKNTIPLIGMSGIFFFINKYIILWLDNNFATIYLNETVICFLLAFLEISVSTPFVFVFNMFLAKFIRNTIVNVQIASVSREG
jgi:fucose 4-O-acetylase-like acetyltransferase